MGGMDRMKRRKRTERRIKAYLRDHAGQAIHQEFLKKRFNAYQRLVTLCMQDLGWHPLGKGFWTS